MAQPKKGTDNGVAGLLFVGCMFIGGGLGYYFNNIVVGGAIGMGVGFLVMATYAIITKTKV